MAKILIVDDDASLASVFATALKSAGYEVITAIDGTSGLEQAKTQRPNFIILDQVLPDIQGNEVLQTLKQEGETKNIPVAMLSNFGQDELVKAAINAGAVDYILKYQIEPQDLVNKLKELIK